MVAKTTVQKLKGSSPKKNLRGAPATEESVSVSLPGKDNDPPKALGSYALCIFGEKGIGKTSLAAQFPDSLVFQWEPGRKNLKIRQVPDLSHGETPLTWQRYKAYLKLLIKGKHGYKTIVMDTIDRVYEACLQQVCLERGIKHPNDANDYGATWGAVKKEFEVWMNVILENGMTPIFVSHARVQTFQARTGEPFDLVVPTCQGVAWNYMKAACDLALYYGYSGTERIFSIRGSDRLWAACGLEDHFQTPDGEPITTFHAGDSAKDSYQRLCSAFANKLLDREVGEESSDGPVMLSRAKKREKSRER